LFFKSFDEWNLATQTAALGRHPVFVVAFVAAAFANSIFVVVAAAVAAKRTRPIFYSIVGRRIHDRATVARRPWQE